MASEQNLPAWAREPYVRILGAFARFLIRLRVKPDGVTLFSLLPAILAGVATAQSQYELAVVLLLFSGLCDILDGAMARQIGHPSRFGALLDSSVDRLSDAAVALGLVMVYAPHGLAVIVPVLAMLSAYTISYVRARAEGLRFELPRLWMRREDRMAIMVLALLLARIDLPGVAIPAPLTLLLFGALALFGFVAATQALLTAKQLD